MDKILKLKVGLLFLYFSVSFFFLYDENFIQNNGYLDHPHIYGHGLFMVAVLSLGVIFSAMVYNFAFYLYIRNKQYLYYALAQFSILLSLLSIESLLIYPFTEMYGFKSFYLFDVSQTAILIFSLLFIKEFFKVSEKLINVIIYLALFDVVLSLFLGHTVVTKFVPSVMWIFFVLSEVIRKTAQRDAPFYIVMVGWHIVIVIIVLEISYVLNPKLIVFPFLHVAFALESMLLSFALSYRFKLIDDAQKVQQSLLLQQARLASMGEMISIIAHQWRQPLTFLSYSLMHIKQNCQDESATTATIKEANEQIQYMSQTIENFRNFYNPSKEKSTFSIELSCRNILKIVEPSLKALKIQIELKVEEDFQTSGNANEFEQVILNIVNNAKDALVEKGIENGKIVIEVKPRYISIADNAKGIDASTKAKIFEPYFTTKENSDGIGLYIAKTIVESEMKGKLKFVSDEVGTTFKIEFS